MELDGTLEKNLVSAIRSAKRLRGQLVHEDTIEHWTDVLQLAETQLLRDALPRRTLMQLASDLRTELASQARYRVEGVWPARLVGYQRKVSFQPKDC
jgi:hypothetical protein